MIGTLDNALVAVPSLEAMPSTQRNLFFSSLSDIFSTVSLKPRILSANESDQRLVKESLPFLKGYTFVNLVNETSVKPKMRSAQEFFLSDSLMFLEYLRKNSFSTVISTDSQALAFHCLQARRVLGEFNNTLFHLIITGGTARQNDNDEKWYRWPVSQGKLEYCERYTAEQADMALSNDQVFAWCIDHHWSLPELRFNATHYNDPATHQKRITAVNNNSAKSLSICIAHYNYGSHLPGLLNALENQTCQDFEVLLVDDGSTDPSSRSTFDKMKEKYDSGRYRFFSKENEGIGATRNFAAAKARGDLIAFVDADNLPMPDMVEMFVSGMNHSEFDCLTCHYSTFTSDSPPEHLKDEFFRFVPLGPAMELGMVDNVLGDANFCVRKNVFHSLGGFTTDRDRSFEDWELLARLVLSDYSLEVIPQSLIWYRFHETGFSRVTSPYKNHRRVTRVYESFLPPTLRRLPDMTVLPYSKAFGQHLDKIRNLQAYADMLSTLLSKSGFEMPDSGAGDDESASKHVVTGSIDDFRENPLGEIEIHGWVASRDPGQEIQSVILVKSGKPVGGAMVNRWRSDVQKELGSEKVNCGFKIVVAQSEHVKESHPDDLSVFAMDEEGALYPVPWDKVK